MSLRTLQAPTPAAGPTHPLIAGRPPLGAPPGGGSPSRKRKEPPSGTAVDANEAITFHLVKRDAASGAAVVEEDGHFQPEMSHQ